mgnify:CR=1 FL=1
MEASYDRAEFKRSFDRAEWGLLYASVIYKDRWCGSFAIHHTCAKYDGPTMKKTHIFPITTFFLFGPVFLYYTYVFMCRDT